MLEVIVLGQGRLCLKEGHSIRKTRGFVVGFNVGLFGFGCVCCGGGLGFFSRKCLQFRVLRLKDESEMVNKSFGAYF